MDPFFVDLNDRAVFHLLGADRERFLNGQVSNDVRKLPPDRAIPACLMTAKGKMHGFVWISNPAEYLRFDIEGELRESVPARLERYIIADDVTIEDATDRTALFHVVGAPSEYAGPRANRFGTEGIDLFVPAESHGETKARLQQSIPELSSEKLEETRIELGIPKWGAELTADTIPPEAGLDSTAISYSKGCYVGQEVISRIKSVGQVARTLMGLVAMDGQPLPVGANLHAEAAADSRSAGVVTSAVWSSRMSQEIGLGYIKRAFADAGGRVWLEQSGVLREVEIRKLPFLNL